MTQMCIFKILILFKLSFMQIFNDLESDVFFKLLSFLYDVHIELHYIPKLSTMFTRRLVHRVVKNYVGGNLADGREKTCQPALE